MMNDEQFVIGKFGEKNWYVNGQLHRKDGPAVEWSSGSKEYYFNGKHHRLDGPAIEYPNKLKAWYLNGKRHRIDGPAIEYADGYKEWWVNGHKYSEKSFKLEVAEMNKDKPTEIDKDGTKYWKNDKGDFHRIDGPAVELIDGSKLWYINGERHRLDGPAIERSNGYKYWYVNGQLHREEGPAIEHANGTKEWYLNNKHHREDGPAIEYPNGYKEWYINGEKYSETNFNNLFVQKNKNSEYENKILSLQNEINVLKQQIVQLNNGTNDTQQNNTTTSVFKDAGTNALKLAGARQSSRVLTSFAKILIFSIAKYFGKEEQMQILNTEAGDVILEILSPLIIHAMANNKLIPKYAEQIEAIAKLSIDANTSYYAMHYSDKIFDITKNIMSDEETKNKFKQIISIGSNILNKENIESLDFSKNFESILA